jgi:hypothetical protein
MIESLRAKVISHELRASYFASKQNLYEFYINLLMSLDRLHPSEGFDAAALEASERARARTLLETLEGAGADIRQGVDPYWSSANAACSNGSMPKPRVKRAC